ncbi:pyridoxal-dependent decarboxylase, partial [Streptomyces clavuligerus]
PGPAPLQVVCGAAAHHSVRRAAWLLGLPEPFAVPGTGGGLDPAALDGALTELPGPHLVVATAGTTDTGQVDPLADLADLCAHHRAQLHVDAAYGGGLIFSDRHRALVDGLDRADSVSLDLHKMGWQPVAAGLFAVADRERLAPLALTADYLNAPDDTGAGLPDLLGRSLRTTRRPDILKVAVTLAALGREGLARLVDDSVNTARSFADRVAAHPRMELWDRPAMRRALADRDIATVFRLVRRHTGASQTRLGAVTGLAQSDVSAIERGVRTVTSADVLDRINAGLHIPNGLTTPAAPATDIRPGGTVRFAPTRPTSGTRVGPAPGPADAEDPVETTRPRQRSPRHQRRAPHHHTRPR